MRVPRRKERTLVTAQKSEKVKCEDCLYYVKDKEICGHPFLDADLNDDCEWHEPIEGESL